MSERIKAEIIQVGTFDENGYPMYWTFDHHGAEGSVALEVTGGGVLYFAGYSVEELHEIWEAHLAALASPEPEEGT